MISLYEFDERDAFRFASSVGANVRKKGKELEFSLCPYCHGGKHRDRGTFSINVETGQFVCLRSSCGVRGNMITIAKDFNFELTEDVERLLRRGPFADGKFRNFGKKKVESKDKAVEFMKSRGISEDVTRRYEITTRKDNDSQIVFPFRDENGVMWFIKYRNTDPTAIEKYGKEFAEKGGRLILFGMNQCDDENDTLIITEGQMDSLSVTEAGYSNAVSVPNGALGSTWIPACWQWLERFNKIIVFGDYEDGRISLLDMISRRFKKNKAIYHVREEDYRDCKDANDILRKYGTEQIRTCIDNAVPIPVSNLIDMADIPLVYPDERRKFPTGIYPLDKLLNGGMPAGCVTLLNGRTGEGKSCFANQIALNVMDEGHKVMIYSGEMGTTDTKRQIFMQAAGPDFIDTSKNTYNNAVYRIRGSVVDKINDWSRGNMYIYDTSITRGHDEFEELSTLCEKAVMQYGVEFIVIDNLMTAIDLDKIESKDPYGQQGEFVNVLARIALEFDIAILLVAHRRKYGGGNAQATDNEEVMGSSQITNLVGLNIFYGRKMKEVEEDGGRKRRGKPSYALDQSDPTRYIKVTKNRIDGQVNMNGIHVEYDPSCCRIYANCRHDNHYKAFGWSVDVDDDDTFDPVLDDTEEIPF